MSSVVQLKYPLTDTSANFDFSGLDLLEPLLVATKDQVTAWINGTLLTQGVQYFVNETTKIVTLDPTAVAPYATDPVNDILTIRRNTYSADVLRIFTDPGRLSGEHLNDNYKQLLYLLQEMLVIPPNAEEINGGLTDIGTLSLATLQDKDFLQYDAVAGHWENVANRVTTMSEFRNFHAQLPETGDGIKWDAVSEEFVLFDVVENLADLADVDLTGLADDYILRYDLGSATWIPEVLPEFDLSANHTFTGKVTFTQRPCMGLSLPLNDDLQLVTKADVEALIDAADVGGGGGSGSSTGMVFIDPHSTLTVGATDVWTTEDVSATVSDDATHVILEVFVRADSGGIVGQGLEFREATGFSTLKGALMNPGSANEQDATQVIVPLTDAKTFDHVKRGAPLINDLKVIGYIGGVSGVTTPEAAEAVGQEVFVHADGTVDGTIDHFLSDLHDPEAVNASISSTIITSPSSITLPEGEWVLEIDGNLPTGFYVDGAGISESNAQTTSSFRTSKITTDGTAFSLKSTTNSGLSYRAKFRKIS